MCPLDPNLFPFTGHRSALLLLLDQTTAATMAAISTSVASALSSILFKHPKEVLSLSLSLSSSPFFLFFCVFKAHFLLQKPLTFRCSAQSRDGGKAPPLLQLVVGGVAELLKLLSPRIQRSTAAIALASPSVASIANDRCVIAEMTIEMQEMRLLWLIAWMIWFGFFERTTIVLISSQVVGLVNPIC